MQLFRLIKFVGLSCAISLIGIQNTVAAKKVAALTETNPRVDVSAGPDQVITFPNSAQLSGYFKIQSNAPGLQKNIEARWSMLSGPAAAAFSDTSSLAPRVEFSNSGIYVLQLSAVQKNHVLAIDTLTLVINRLPEVSAGANQTITRFQEANLEGTISDDGLPNPPGQVTSSWSLQSGPGSVLFSDATRTNTLASFSSVGTYILKLTADDGTGALASAVASVTVLEEPPSNLRYSNPTATYAKAITIPVNVPLADGGPVDHYSISGILPDGLVFDSTSGTISGAPAVTQVSTPYLITATNSGGSTSTVITITVNDIPPSDLTYDEMTSDYLLGTEIKPNTPSSRGGNVTSYSISGSLPDGLIFNSMTGVISGIPLAPQESASYRIIASNSGGSASVTISISVSDPISPPVLSTTLSDNQLFSKPVITIPVSVASRSEVTTTISLNGVQVYQTQRKEIAASAALAIGENRIEIHAVDHAGLMAVPVVLTGIVFNPPVLSSGIADPAVVSPAFNMPQKLSDALLDKLSVTTSLAAWATGRTDEFSCNQSLEITPSAGQPFDLATLDPMAEVTPAVQRLANQLGSADQVYFYVRDQIAFLPRFGLTQTAAQTLQSGVGTAADKAAALISLFRALSIPSRYVAGDILVDEDHLKGLYGVSGTKDLAWAEYMSLKGYFQGLHPSGFDGSTMVYYRNGERAWRIPHVWVQAAIELDPGNVQWIEVDPSSGLIDRPASEGYSKLDDSLTAVSNIDSYIFQGPNLSGTLADAMMYQIGLLDTNHPGITDLGPSVLNRYSVIPPGSISVVSPCVKMIADFLPLGYQFTSHVRVIDPSSATAVLETRIPLAAFTNEPLSMSLLPVEDGIPNTLAIRQGDKIIVHGPRPEGAKFTFYHAIQEPLEYGGSAEARIVNNRPTEGIYVLRHAVAPISSNAFYTDLRTSQSNFKNSTSDEDKIISILQLGSSLALMKAADHDSIINRFRGVGRTTEHLILANTSNSLLSPNAVALMGYAPAGIDMDWDMTGPIYSRTGNFSDFAQYRNIAHAKGELVVANSSLEGQVWNDLFGQGGSSAVHVLQTASVTGVDIIRGSSLTLDALSSLIEQLNPSLSGEVPLLQALAHESPYLFSLTNAYTSPSGWKGGALIIVPSSSMGQAAAYLLSEEHGALLGGNYSNTDCEFDGDGNLPSCTSAERHEGVLYDSGYPMYFYSEMQQSSSLDTTLPDCRATATTVSIYCTGRLQPGDTIQCSLNYRDRSWDPCLDIVFQDRTGGTGWQMPIPLDQTVTNPTILKATNLAGGPSNTENRTSCAIGQPVNIASGTMWHDLVDFKIPGRTKETSIDLKRTYTTQPVWPSSEFGPNWWHNWETRLLFGSDFPGTSYCKKMELPLDAQQLLTESGFTFDLPDECFDGADAIYAPVVWVDENGGPWTFNRRSDFSLQAPEGLGATLSESETSYILTKKNGTKLIFSNDALVAPRGRLTSIVEPHGETVQLAYDPESKLSSMHSSLSGTIRLVRNEAGLIESITRERDGLTYVFKYNSRGMLESSSDFDGNTTRYEYNEGQNNTPAHGLLSSIIDPLGRKITYTYYNDGRAFEQSEPGNGQWSFFYSAANDSGRSVSVKGVDGTATEFRLDANGLVSEIIHPDQSRNRYNIQWNGSTTEIDETGASTITEYDRRGNLISVRKPNGTSTNFGAYINGKPTYVQNAAGATSLSIDPINGNISRIENIGTGLSLDFGYDDFGNLLTVSNGLSSYANSANEKGLLTTVYDARNPETRTHDSRGRIATRTFATGRVLTYTWDDHDRITRVDDTTGPSLIQVWDQVGRLKETTVTDGATNQTTKYQWDDRDRLIEVTDAMHRTTKIEYDKVAIGCNVVDKPSKITDHAGRKTQFFYDLRQRLTRVVDAKGGVTRYNFNLRGDLIGVTDPENNHTAFSYDENRRVIKRERPSSVNADNGIAVPATEVTTYSWDAADRLTREEQGLLNSDLKRVTEYEWDALSRLTRKRLTKQQSGQIIEEQDDARYTYQPQLDVVKIASANNGNVNLSFTSEPVPPFASTGYGVSAATAGNPLSLIEGNFTVNRDITGEIAGITDVNGKTIFTAQYDPVGRMMTMTSGDFVAGQSLGFTLNYDSFLRKRGVIATTGLVGSFSYDLLNRLTSLYWNGQDGTGASLALSENPTYDPLTGNISSVAREFGTFTYGHDPLDQLLSVAYSGTQPLGAAANQSWQYDYAGNRVSQGSLNLANILVENSSHKFVPDEFGTGSLGQKIDRVSGASENFSYRADQKLTSYSKDGLVAEYFYDALGRRIAKRLTKGPDSAFTQSYVYLGEEDKILLGKAGDGEIALYLDGEGIDEHLGEVSSRGAKAYATDHLGSVLNGEAAGAAKAFGPWGENLNDSAPAITAASSPVVYGFTGRQLDPESGTYYYRARTYVPEVGRFLQPDPIGFTGTGSNLYQVDLAEETPPHIEPNLYEYAFNNPVNYTDASGMYPDMSAGWDRWGKDRPQVPLECIAAGCTGATVGLTLACVLGNVTACLAIEPVGGVCGALWTATPTVQEILKAK